MHNTKESLGGFESNHKMNYEIVTDIVSHAHTRQTLT